LTIDQVAPDHSTVSRFRKALTDAKVYDTLFKLINLQLELHQIIVVKGVIVDASIVDTPLKPKERTIHKRTQDREETEQVEVKKEYAARADKAAF